MDVFRHDCVVVGTGAAGYNAACRLKQLGRDVALVTEGVRCGTSRNTGSDKQTYYKLGLAGDSADSVYRMAKDLFDGGSMDGDNALCEAALSARCFLNLCELGVPFPANRYGEYVGYKTDHDPCARATSAGPLTSRFMTEALERQAAALGIPVYDGCLAVEVLKSGGRVAGLMCIRRQDGGPVAFRCPDVVLATGGPAGIYAHRVYPEGHTGSTSLALLAGAKGQNLALWQYGLASVAPRWNVSGTYMQVLPRFVSVDSEGREYEFLSEYLSDPYEAMSLVFLKGYQWPFDSTKARTGSSRIDLWVREQQVEKGRRVYLDFTRNPFGLDRIDFDRLEPEARDYLNKAGACFGTPIQRLEKMNMPAVELYRGKGVDLRREYLEIALCAQHSNGGVAVDLWWRSCVPGLFAVGECAGTHGIRRPGGSALNSGQVGSLRAARYIAAHPNPGVEDGEFERLVSGWSLDFSREKGEDPEELIRRAGQRMSACAAAVRVPEEMARLLEQSSRQLKGLKELVRAEGPEGLWSCCKLRDLLVTQCAVLTAMLDPVEDPGQVQEVELTGTGFAASRRPVRPLPRGGDVFETVWRGFRENGNVE